MRVAIAGRVKAGKSTLLNALVGDELAATDAGECTRIVTWYRFGTTYRVTLHPRHAPVSEVRFRRETGALDIDVGGHDPSDLRRIVVEWPSQILEDVTLIDTPGVGSITADVARPTFELLGSGDGTASEVDAVLYLLRHVHGSDAGILEAFHGHSLSTSPTTALGILSRADEIAAGRLDSMQAAERAAARLREDRRLRRLVQTVFPVAGLLAQAGAGLRQADFAALRALATLDDTTSRALILSVDRFGAEGVVAGVPAPVRRDLLDRLGMVGVRLAIAHLQRDRQMSADELANRLVEISGIRRVREALLGQFASRADLLRTYTALRVLSSLAADPVDGTESLLRDVERLAASMHEFSELGVLDAIRGGEIELPGELVVDAEQLLGVDGPAVHRRLGLAADVESGELLHRAGVELSRWSRFAEHPLTPVPSAEVARVLVRTCEGIVVGLTAE